MVILLVFLCFHVSSSVLLSGNATVPLDKGVVLIGQFVFDFEPHNLQAGKISLNASSFFPHQVTSQERGWLWYITPRWISVSLTSMEGNMQVKGAAEGSEQSGVKPAEEKPSARTSLPPNQRPYFVLLDDQDESFGMVEAGRDLLSCKDIWPHLRYKFPLPPPEAEVGGEGKIANLETSVHERIRARVWWAGLMYCPPFKASAAKEETSSSPFQRVTDGVAESPEDKEIAETVVISYRMRMTNPNFLFTEFSYDHQGVYQASLIFLFLWAYLLVKAAENECVIRRNAGFSGNLETGQDGVRARRHAYDSFEEVQPRGSLEGYPFLNLNHVVSEMICYLLAFANVPTTTPWGRDGLQSLARSLFGRSVGLKVMSCLLGALHLSIFALTGLGSGFFWASKVLEVGSRVLLMAAAFERVDAGPHGTESASALENAPLVTQKKRAAGYVREEGQGLGFDVEKRHLILIAFFVLSCVFELWGNWKGEDAQIEMHFTYDNNGAMFVIALDLLLGYQYFSQLYKSLGPSPSFSPSLFPPCFLGLWMCSLPLVTFLGEVISLQLRYRWIWIVRAGLHLSAAYVMLRWGTPKKLT